MIVKITRKSPLRIVPSVTSSSDNPNSGSYGGSYGSSASYQSSPGFQSNYNPNSANRGTNSTYSPNSLNSGNSGNFANSGNLNNQPMPKVSLFAESQPDDNQFVTAYPLILHKWQAEPDAEVISLRPPILAEPCLHAGVNILKSTDLSDEQLNDNFTKDYLLTMTSTNGFKKEFPLRKNLGLNGWELNITPQDLQEFPKIQMNLESVISGTRGFNELKSPPFFLPIAIGGNWQMTPESQQNFVVGGKRRITIKNTLGNCQCLQAVIYKPSFGGQFVFEANQGGSNSGNNSFNNQNNSNQNALQYAPDGKEVSFEVDATNFQAGAGEIELRTYGGEAVKIPLKLYPAPPTISEFKIRRGDKEILLTGERLEQIQAISINGKRAVNPYLNANPSNQTQSAIQTSYNPPSYTQPNTYQSGQVQPTYPNNPSFPNQPTQPSYNQPNNNQPPTNYQNQPNPVTATTPNSVNSPASVNYPQNTLSSNQKVFVLEDKSQVIDSTQVSLELSLEDNRTFSYPQRIQTLQSRPTIIANENNEISGTFLKDKGGRMRAENEVVVQEPNRHNQWHTKQRTKDKEPKTFGKTPNPKSQTPFYQLTHRDCLD